MEPILTMPIDVFAAKLNALTEGFGVNVIYNDKCTLTANLACDGLRLLAHKDDPRNIVSMTFCKTGIGGLHIDEECVGSVDWWEDVDGIGAYYFRTTSTTVEVIMPNGKPFTHN